MNRRLRTPALAALLASLSLFAFACGGDDDGNGLDPLPTMDSNPPVDELPDETPTNDAGAFGDGSDNGTDNGATDPGDGALTGSVSATGIVEGEFAPTSAIATETGELHALLSSDEGAVAVLLIAPTGSVTLEAMVPDLGPVTFEGDGATVETNDSGAVICAVSLADKELTSSDGESVSLDGEITVSGGVC